MPVELPHDLLVGVARPGRYVGGERNSRPKDHEQVHVTFALAFPDTYEVGMSHLGLHVLYQELNRRDDTACERVFAPWIDMEAEMRRRGIPLWSLETRTPLSEFMIVGFSLQHELHCTNVLQMLDLAGIPRLCRDRGAGDPLVCAGGPFTANPEPMADVFDFLVVGDGEEVVHELVDAVAGAWPFSGRSGRDAFLRALGKIPGIYVPGGYEPVPGGGSVVPRARDGWPERVRRRVVTDMDSLASPDRPVVSLIEAVHDRAAVEVQRGCGRGCRFCQAGFAYRPRRERSSQRVCEQARSLIANTGYEELSLLSLSTSDYSHILPVVTELSRDLAERRVSISLPSLRVDAFSVELAKKVQAVRKSGLTFAPEAGSERLRQVINKQVTDDDLMTTADAAWRSGWDRLKLYFMIGLPTETDDDVRAIVELVRELHHRHRRGVRDGAYRGRGLRLAVSISPFVPKPHTPFQWAAQERPEVLAERVRLLREGLGGRWVELAIHDLRKSQLEAVFARGDRRLLPVVERAYDLGCRFEPWTETWNPDSWQRAFSECGVDPADYAFRVREEHEPFPWDVIDVGVRREFLWHEYGRGLGGTMTPECRSECAGCGIGQWGLGLCGGGGKP